MNIVNDHFELVVRLEIKQSKRQLWVNGTYIKFRDRWKEDGNVELILIETLLSE